MEWCRRVIDALDFVMYVLNLCINWNRCWVGRKEG